MTSSRKHKKKKKDDRKIKSKKGACDKSRVEKKRHREGKELSKRRFGKTDLDVVDGDLFILEQRRGLLREKLKLFSSEKSEDTICDGYVDDIKTNRVGRRMNRVGRETNRADDIKTNRAGRNSEFCRNFKCFTVESIENAVCNLVSFKVIPVVVSDDCKMEGSQSSDNNLLQDSVTNLSSIKGVDEKENDDGWSNSIRHFSENASFLSGGSSEANNKETDFCADEIGNVCINNEKSDKKDDCELRVDNDNRKEKLEEAKFKELREYEYTVRGTGLIEEPWDPKEKKVKFKVVSYNVLSQTLLVDNIGLYRHHDKRYLDWNYRSKLLMKELDSLKADVLCLQEVQDDQKVTFFDELTQKGYKGVYKKRTSDKADGCAIYYKTSKFELIDFASVEFFQPEVDVLNRDNIALIVKLHPVGFPKNPLVVSTTHLLYNPRRHDVKLAQMQVLLAEIERFAYKDENAEFKYHPVILTGDFNLEPHTGVYQLLMTGRLHYSVLDRKKLLFAGIRPYPDNTSLPLAYGPPMGNRLLPPDLGITDNCQHLGIVESREKPFRNKTEGHDSLIGIYNSDRNNQPRDCRDCGRMSKLFSTGVLWNPSFDFHTVYYHDNDKNEIEATTKHDDWLTVDYIFYTPLKDPKFQQQQLQLVSRMRLPSVKECEKHLKNIPNRICPSDHLPLVATFFLRIPSKPV